MTLDNAWAAFFYYRLYANFRILIDILIVIFITEIKIFLNALNYVQIIISKVLKFITLLGFMINRIEILYINLVINLIIKYSDQYSKNRNKFLVKHL